MRQPNGATPNRWVGGECANKQRDRIGWECAVQVKQRQIGGGSAGNAPAKRNNTKLVHRRRMRRPSRTTPNRWISGKCAGKRKRMWCGDEMRRPNSNTKSMDRRLTPANEREWGAAMGCTGQTATPNRWIGGECAGKQKRMRRGDEMRRPNEKKRRRGDGMRRPNKETAAR